MERASAVVSLSGGMDSATVLAEAIDQLGVKNVIAVGFKYGSKHNRWENVAAENVADSMGIPFELIDLSSVMKGFTSNLLLSGGEIPEGHYEDQNMALTVVPGRNIIFASILAGYAWSKDKNSVWLGIHSGDHFIYEDCRPAFYRSMNEAVKNGTGNRVSLHAPFLDSDKIGIIKRGLELKVPYELTRTCYKTSQVSCGKCGSCQERRAAWASLGLIDPIPYEYEGPLAEKTI